MSQQRIDEIRQAVASITDYIQSVGIQSFSDEAKMALADLFSQAADRIADLRAQIQAPAPAVPQGALLLWQIAGSQPDAFVNYLRSVPDPQLNALLTQPDILNNLIEYLQREHPPGETPVVDGITHADLQSSNVFGFQYNPRNRRLLVRFNSGSVYGYDNVPPAVYQVFAKGAVPARTSGRNRWGRWWQGKIPSLGAAFYQMIRLGNYPYQRLS